MMMTELSTYDVNKTAIKLLWTMIIGGPQVSGIDVHAALNELIPLLDEQCKLVAAKIEGLKEDNQFLIALVCQIGDDYLKSRDDLDLLQYRREKLHLQDVTRLVRKHKRELARLKAMLANAENRRENERKWLLAITFASHPRVGQASPMGKLNDDVLAKIALLTLS